MQGAFGTCEIIFLVGEDKSALRVFNINPRLNRAWQMNSFSRRVNSGSGPLFDLSESTDSPKFQYHFPCNRALMNWHISSSFLQFVIHGIKIAEFLS